MFITTGRDPARGSDQDTFPKKTRVESGRVGLGGAGNLEGRVGSGRVRRGVGSLTGRDGSSRVGSDRCWKSHGTGRVESGRVRISSKYRVRSGRVTLIRPDPTRSDPREVIQPVKQPSKVRWPRSQSQTGFLSRRKYGSPFTLPPLTQPSSIGKKIKARATKENGFHNF